MIELYQAEWCPHSHRVRQRFTELGVAFVAQQVEADAEDRRALHEISGQASIPVLVDGAVVVTDPDQIVAYLDERFEPRSDARQHREQAIVEADLLGRPPAPWPG